MIQEIVFHWKAQRPYQGGAKHSDGLLILIADPFDMTLMDTVYERISKLMGWDDMNFVVDSLTVIASRVPASEMSKNL